MNATPFEYHLTVRDGRTHESGSTLLGYDRAEAHKMMKHILDQFVTNGYVIYRSLIVQDMWVARCGAEYTVLEMLEIGAN